MYKYIYIIKKKKQFNIYDDLESSGNIFITEEKTLTPQNKLSQQYLLMIIHNSLLFRIV